VVGRLLNVLLERAFQRPRVISVVHAGAGILLGELPEDRQNELLGRFGFELDPWLPLGEASPPQRAAVAIVRAVAGWQAGRGVLILDEPTAALPAQEVDQLFRLIREISSTGTAVILVSHRLDEVMAIADHATVMREGAKVWDGDLSETSLAGLVDLIANTEDEDKPQEEALRGYATFKAGAPCALEVRNLRARYLRGVSLQVRQGEVLGIAGLLGSGREELPYIVAGARIAVGRALIGVLVGEFFAASEGIGYAISRFGDIFSLDRMFACILTVMAIAVVLTEGIRFAERSAFPWRTGQ